MRDTRRSLLVGAVASPVLAATRPTVAFRQRDSKTWGDAVAEGNVEIDGN